MEHKPTVLKNINRIYLREVLGLCKWNKVKKNIYLVRKPDKSGLFIITKHSVFGIQQLLHDQEKELLSHSASIHCLFPHENHLPQN